MYFQDVIATLQRYWGGQGCVVLQPHDLMMGAATFHPATVLRTLGSGPWRAAFVQPSRRPGDARYGDNPNRLGQYYQFQVILKPSPSDSQDLYLRSLDALGIDRRRHDLRFVEDDWESPTLGAWGLGWEVWLNGMEVSQYTYFQQVAGHALRPIPVEYTYGLERLTMALQGKRSVYDIEWVAGVTYGDVFHRNEVEQSSYNFELADTDWLFEQYRRADQECRRLCALGVALPAYDQAISTSHLFNLLLARGAISVAERARYIKGIRELAVRCSEVWLSDKAAAAEFVAPRSGPTGSSTGPTGPASLLIELVTEELPASMVRPALEALRLGLLGLLRDLEHGEVRTYATPRRLCVVIDDVAPSRPFSERVVTGPPADRCFDAAGKPTPAAIGFATGKGASVESLVLRPTPKGNVVALVVAEGGERAIDLVAAGLGSVVAGLPFTKSMEWGSGGPRFGRPLSRVNALLGSTVIPCEVMGIVAGNVSVGHRLANDPTFTFDSPAAWLSGLAARQVEPDLAVREHQIRELLASALQALGADLVTDDELVEEVTHLVEWPKLIVGTFDEALLELPSRLLVEAMRKHQRYFPVWRAGKLTHYFVAISNAPEGDERAIAEGMASVLLARFDDARFFFAADRKRRLEEGDDGLARMVWIRGLGHMACRARRITALGQQLAGACGADVAVVARAGRLAKSDLVSAMVNEFPELQGHMGRLYAFAQGESFDVAVAIEEHWLPRFAGDAVATTSAGVTLALADRLDQLVGCFGIGMAPKGNDPQGSRRAALGIVTTLVRHGVRCDLRAWIRTAIDGVHAEALADGVAFDKWRAAQGTGATPKGADGLVQELVDFILTRQRADSSGAATDLVDAVFAVGPSDPVVLDRKLKAVVALANEADLGPVLQTFKRVANITKGTDFPLPEFSSLTVEAERTLFHCVREADAAVAEAVEQLDMDGAFRHILSLQQPVAALFDAVMVDSPDPAERAARLGLLRSVSTTFLRLADFSKIASRPS